MAQPCGFAPLSLHPGINKYLTYTLLSPLIIYCTIIMKNATTTETKTPEGLMKNETTTAAAGAASQITAYVKGCLNAGIAVSPTTVSQIAALSIYSKICTAHGRPVNPDVVNAISSSPNPIHTATASAIDASEMLSLIASESWPGLETLETRGADSLDFHETSVGLIRAALERAFELGQANPEEPAGSEHDCWDNAVPYRGGGALGHGWQCGRCGDFLQAG